MKSKTDIIKQIKSLAERRRGEEVNHQMQENQISDLNISKNFLSQMSDEIENSGDEESRFRDEDISEEDDQQGEQVDEQGEQSIEARTMNLFLMREYVDGLENFKKRRGKKYVDGKLDLGVLYIQQLVYCLYEEEIIVKDIMLSIKNFSIFATLDFIKKYQISNLVDFDFENQKFTIIDHRRICNILVKKDPSKYQYTSSVYCLPFEAYIFLKQIYQMPEDKYENILTSIDSRYQRLWWDSILQGKKGVYQIKTKPVSQVEPEPIEDKKEVEGRAGVKRKGVVKKNEEEEKLQEEEKKKPNFSSGFSSSVFESQMACQSFTVSLGKDSHSISDLSDLFSDSEEKEKKKGKKEKKKQKNDGKKSELKQQKQEQNGGSSQSSFSHPDFSD